MALINREGEIKAGLPLFEVRSPILGTRLVSIPFATLCDPLVSEREQLGMLLETADGLMRALGAGYLEIRAHHSAQLLRSQMMQERLAYKCHFLDLTIPLEQLFAKFHRHAVRYMIRKAGRFPFDLSIARDVVDMESFYRLYVLTRKRLSLPPQPFKFFLELQRQLGPKGGVLVLLAGLKGKTVGGLLLLYHKERISVEAVGFDESESHKGTQFFLFWEAIKMARNRGFKIFDFGRTSVENQGLMTFKGRWGTKLSDLPFFYYPTFAVNELRPREKTIPYKMVRFICKVTPVRFYPLLGELVYKHLG
ncbi:MAG: GNAT family N-acetyltransferase [Thermodesulfobacteriota bacterium]